LAGLLAFALYAYTAAPGIVTFFDDTLEFQTVAPTFGIAHPTGYPLYTLIGGAWVHLLPFGTWAGRLNLLSALFAAMTIALLAHITARLVTRSDGSPNLWAALAAATVFALGPVWWGQATVAEVYALHNLFVASILAATIGINQRSHPDRHVTFLMLLFGLGLTHHRTTILLLPPVALYLLWSVPGIWRPRRVWLVWLAALLLPLILYLYIPLRAAMGVRDLNGSYLPGWTGFWNHVLARQYGAFFSDNALAAGLTPAQWLELVRTQTSWLSLLLAALGLVWLVDRHWRPARAWWLVLGVLLINLLFAIVYRVPDPEVFLLPALLCLAIFSGGGVGLLSRALPSRGGSLLGAVVLALLILLPLGRGAAVNRRHHWAAHDQARRMAQTAFPPNSRVVGLEGEMTALLYMQIAEGLAANATLITANDPDKRRATIEQFVNSGAPTYITRELDGIADVYSYSGEAELVRVWPRGESQTTLPAPEDAIAYGERIKPLNPLLLDNGRVQIEAYRFRPVAGLAQPTEELTLYWRVVQPTDKTLKVSLRLLDAGGMPYQWPAQDGEEGRQAVEDRFPLHQVAPTPTWVPGELIQDVHTIQLPPSLYSSAQVESPILLVIIYDAATALEEGRIEIMF
jgi:hypothetical protein